MTHLAHSLGAVLLPSPSGGSGSGAGGTSVMSTVHAGLVSWEALLIAVVAAVVAAAMTLAAAYLAGLRRRSPRPA
jgi:hypothetical protein